MCKSGSWLVATVLVLFPAIAVAADIDGTWALYAIDRGEIVDATRLEVAVHGNEVIGSGRDLILTGTQSGDVITGSAAREDGRLFGTFEIRLSGNDGRGVVRRGDVSTDIQLRKLPARAAPRSVLFEPNTYPRLFGTAQPALRINAGDTVRTATLDAGGRDAADASRAAGGNPQNGPIYVDGAIPGDTLAVTINRIRLDKTVARSGSAIVAAAVTAEYASGTKPDPRIDGEWKLDGTRAMLARPSERLSTFSVQLKPMIGGLGVAPARGEAFRAQQLGSYGGNLDYNGLTEGTTVYLPVARDGALLYVGDVHALQGDGEITGDALETSAEIELTIDVVPGYQSAAPRAENADYLMSSGIAGSLEGAVRQATTQLTQWLERDYGLTHSEAAIVLGTTIQYDLAAIGNPQFHVVAKVRKGSLAGLRRWAR